MDIGLGGNNNSVTADTNIDINVYSLAGDGNDYHVAREQMTRINTLISDDYYGGEGDAYNIIDGGNQTVTTGFGNDSISLETEGNHIITTNSGDDTVKLGSGDDIVNAGSGDDKIYTGEGDDTIIFNKGYGSDSLFDTLGNDTLRFGEGITKDDLNVRIEFDSEFQISSTNGYDKQNSEITTLSDGSLVVTWQTYYQDGNQNGVYAQKYDTNGSAMGEEFLVNTYTNNSQYNSSITALNDGGFVISWDSYQDGSGTGVYAQRYDSDGIKAGDEFLVNTYINNSQYNSSITALNDGGFVVSWDSYYQDGSGYGVYAQRYDSQGNKAGTEFLVNTYTSNSQNNSAITALSDGGFVVSWDSYYQDGSSSGVYAQRYDSDGIKAGDEFLVNTYTNNSQYNSSITALNDGGFVVSWDSYYQDGSGTGVYAQRYDSQGNKAGTEFLVNTYTNDYQSDSSITALNDGGFIIIWQSSQTDNSEIFAKRYDSEGCVVELTNEEHANLVISLKDNPDDKIFIKDWFRDGRIENFEFADGSTISDHEIVSLIGTDEKEIILGTEGENTLAGNAGDDRVEAGLGNDTYNFNRESGHDTFFDKGGFDTINFGENITKDDVILKKVDNNLSISIKEDGKTFEELVDTISVSDWFSSENMIERFTFANGYVMELDEILSLIDADGLIFYGTPEEDEMNGGNEADIIMARESDDIVHGNAGDDILIGEEGNDTLYGETGDDLLYGGSGDDVYIVSKNDGNDRILDASGSDTLRFTDDISVSDLTVTYDNDDLFVSIEGTTVRLQNWYKSDNRVESFAFASGEVLSVNEIINLEQEDIKGVDEGTQFESDVLNDVFHAQAGDDSFEVMRNHGDNIVIDSGGNDKLVFAQDINISDLGISYENNDLIVSIEGTTLRLTNWYKPENRIETFEFNDGTQLSVNEIIKIMADSDDNNIKTTELSIDINALDGDDVIYSNSGSDVLHGLNGNDYLDAGAGVDVSIGGLGNDTYVFDYGYGKDIVDDQGSQNDIDSVVFGANIATNDVKFIWEKESDNLIVHLLDSVDDKLTTKGWYNKSNQIERFIFADGTVYDEHEIIKLLTSDDADDIRTLEGDSEAFAEGSLGSDELFSGDGNDLLLGDKGDDVLFGGRGNDTYVYNHLDGHDTIYDRNGFYWKENLDIDAGHDTLAFGEGITQDMLLAKWDKDTDSLIIGVNYDKESYVEFDSLVDTITMQSWFRTENRIESISFVDGNTLDVEGIFNLLATDGDDYLRTLEEGGAVYLKDGNDVIIGSSGKDILDGGLGDDYLTGGNNDDELLGNKGHDVLLGEEGQDFLDGSSGDDMLSGGKGLDVYIFGYGYGKDTIQENGNHDEIDTVYFEEGVSLENLWINIKENSVEIALKDGVKSFENLDDMLTIENAFSLDDKVELFRFHDDSEVTFEELTTLPIADNQTIDLKEDTQSLNSLVVNNPLEKALTYEIINMSDDGNFSINENGEWEYAPNNNYNGEDTVTIKVTNIVGLSSTVTLSFDIEAVNDAPTVESIDTTSLLEDATVIAGQINANDVDNNAVLSYTAATVAGLTLNDDGSYNFDASDAAYQHLEDGAVESVTIQVTITDEHSASVTTDIVFEITGTNDKPIIEDITAIRTAEDASLVTGNITSTDVDDNATATYSTTDSVAGFTLNDDGSYSFNPADNAYQSLAKDEIQEITIGVTVTDDKGATDTKDLVITVVGTNDVPTVLNANESFTLQNIRNIEGKVEATDTDGDTLNYSVLTDAQNGTVTVDENGNWHYKADGSFNGNDSATILVDDGNGASVTSVLNFTVDGYIYEGGDLVIDEASGNDTLSMNNINKNELGFTRSLDDLQIAVADQGVITLKNYFNDIEAGVESLQTAQGDISLSRDVINDVTSGWWCSSFIARDTQDNLMSGTNHNDWIKGNSGDDIIFGHSRNDYLFGNDGDDLLIGGAKNDTLYGGNGQDTLYGDSGNDKLYGGYGNDSLMGGLGKDTLYGYEGDDFLSGGKGKDTLKGGLGNDTYFFSKGDGKDFIHDTDDTSFFWWNKEDAGHDTIAFSKDITKDDISFIMNKGDLHIQYGDSDTIKVKDQDSKRNQIEKLELSDGNYLTNDDIDLVIQQINAYGYDNGMHHINNKDIQNNADMMNIVSSAWNA